jgi:CO/xanthine dehydrogenase FAD-binding subunit
MRSRLQDYEMRSVRTLDEALRVMAGEPGAWTPFAGGTDLMVLLDAGTLKARRLLDIWSLTELGGVVTSADTIGIGALVTYTELLESDVVQRELPLLARAARDTGAAAIQNRGTVGGNIANASPAADLPPALLVYDAVVEVGSIRGRRHVPYSAFHRGYKQMDLAPDELILSVNLPRGRGGWKQAYRKVGTRRAQAISKICFAAAAEIDAGAVREVRIALGSVAPTVVRARAAESILRGRQLDAGLVEDACAALAMDISPIDDMRSSASYRRRVASNLLEDFLS